jgi:putative nucleotidyltransferase with HDIG domain
MSDFADKIQRYEEVIQRIAGAMRGARLYAAGHPRVTSNIESLLEALRHLHSIHPSVLIGFVGGEIIADDTPLPRASASRGDLIQRFESLGIFRLRIERGITADELATFVRAVTTATPKEPPAEGEADEEPDFLSLTHLQAGRILVDPNAGDWGSGTGATARRVYASSVTAAQTVWDSAQSEGRPELPVARDTVDNLAQAVTHNRSAMVGLTAMQKHDNYTFTHMVNVSILTMGQARALGMDGRRLREVGLAALMHDIGKVRTPVEILNKPEKLTEQEFALMQRHTTDGAQILRRTPEMPSMAPIVAFEHHLRLDGSGYPQGVQRTSLNLATMLCSIADVYDAMRSQRTYQQAFPNERVLAVMKQKDGQQFDQHLVRRFVQLIGIYPPGTLVRLDSNEIAVVVRVHAPDPYRPTVRVLYDDNGSKVQTPEERNLWELGHHGTITAPLDPAEYKVDALSFV